MLQRLFNFKGINLWLLGSSLGLNLVWGGLMVYSTGMLSADRGTLPEWWGLMMIAAAFLGPLLIGFLIGRLSHDRRGPTYGVVGSLGGAALLGIFVMLSGSLEIGFITAAVAIMGGFNGGMFSQRRD
jgi:hypothetical protein